MNDDETHITSMVGPGLLSYIVPELNSYLLTNGKVRMFDMTRMQDRRIVPHSHRFDLLCFVICGEVKNTLWSEPWAFLPTDSVGVTFA